MLICYLQMLDTPEEKVRFEQIYLKYNSLMYHVADGIHHLVWHGRDPDDTYWITAPLTGGELIKIAQSVGSTQTVGGNQ